MATDRHISRKRDGNHINRNVVAAMPPRTCAEQCHDCWYLPVSNHISVTRADSNIQRYAYPAASYGNQGKENSICKHVMLMNGGFIDE
jgi:hypothetical protein